MALTHPAEIDAMHQQIDQLERENQVLRNVISHLADQNAKAARMLRELGEVVWRDS